MLSGSVVVFTETNRRHYFRSITYICNIYVRKAEEHTDPNIVFETIRMIILV